jgi:hypothetical protein
MNRWKPMLIGALVLASTTACFRQVVQTGRAPSQTVVQQSWVSTWIFGLVAATPIDARAKCPSGVATVETLTSFPNGLLSALTFGIWAPQTVRITCASGTAALPNGIERLHVAASATDTQLADVLTQAAVRSAQIARPVAVQFGDITSTKE